MHTHPRGSPWARGVHRAHVTAPPSHIGGSTPLIAMAPVCYAALVGGRRGPRGARVTRQHSSGWTLTKAGRWGRHKREAKALRGCAMDGQMIWLGEIGTFYKPNPHVRATKPWKSHGMWTEWCGGQKSLDQWPLCLLNFLMAHMKFETFIMAHRKKSHVKRLWFLFEEPF
jgi:hypothetical protein